MGCFDIPGKCNDKPDDNKQKGHRKTSRFSSISHADQPSTSVSDEKEGVSQRWQYNEGDQSILADLLKQIKPFGEIEDKAL